ncbi:MAG: hypothetical protein K2Y14_13890 [Burkholderiales bacterium]|nr:hypothetical protein [Burkholderiales bacterium]
MLCFTKYQAADLSAIELQDHQQHIRDDDPAGYRAVAEQIALAPSYTIWHAAHQRPLAIISTPVVAPGRVMCCTLLSRDAAQHLLGITRIVQNGLQRISARRIEAVTQSNFEQGNKWLKLLGFQLEGTMRSYDYRGKDFNLYSIVRG